MNEMESYNVGTATVIELKVPPDRLDLVLEQVKVLLESGYDVAVERAFNDEFMPARLAYYSVNIQCETSFIDETIKGDGKNDK